MNVLKITINKDGWKIFNKLTEKDVENFQHDYKFHSSGVSLIRTISKHIIESITLYVDGDVRDVKCDKILGFCSELKELIRKEEIFDPNALINFDGKVIKLNHKHNPFPLKSFETTNSSKCNIMKITIDRQSQKVEVLTNDEDIEKVLIVLWFRIDGIHFNAHVNEHHRIEYLNIYINTDMFNINYDKLTEYISGVRKLICSSGIISPGALHEFYNSVRNFNYVNNAFCLKYKNKSEDKRYHIISGFNGRIELIGSDVMYPVVDNRTSNLYEIINYNKCHDKFVFEYIIIRSNRYLFNLIIRSDSLRNSDISEMLKKLNCATEYLGYSPEIYSRINNIVEYYINKEDKYEE